MNKKATGIGHMIIELSSCEAVFNLIKITINDLYLYLLKTTSQIQWRNESDAKQVLESNNLFSFFSEYISIRSENSLVFLRC